MLKMDMSIFLLCLFIFVLLVGILSFLMYKVFILSKKHIELGASDNELINEYYKYGKYKRSKISSILSIIFHSILYIFLISIIMFDIFMLFTENNNIKFKTIKTCESSSMSYKNEDNKYLYENNLENQFSKNDIIIVDKLPNENDLKLYDVILYEKNNILIIHRIVEIRTSPDGTKRYVTQGDANNKPDNKEVLYTQMRGIYTNKKIPFLGIVIRFFRTAAGFLCIGLTLIISIAIPIINKKFDQIKLNRIKELGINEENLTTFK